jgi:hypothetical protein
MHNLGNIVRKRFPQIPVIVVSGSAGDEMPEGLAADAYCPKNEFLSEQLLETMSNLFRDPPLRTAPPDMDHQPVQARCDADGNYIIGCDDCLREFRVRRPPHAGGNGERTPCVHCGKLVQFLVAGQSESA